MNCPYCGSPNAEEWEKCVICGSPLHQSSSPSPEQYVLLYKRPEEMTWRRWPFSSLERAKAMAQHFQARGFETRIMYLLPKPRPVERRRRILFEEVWREVELARQGSHSNPELKLEEKPLTWDAVAAWFEAEGTFETELYPKTRPRMLITRVSIAQKDRKLSGYKLIENIKRFIDTQLGTTGSIYEYPDMPTQAIWTAHLDCYKIAAEVLPYQHHPAKIDRTIEMLKAIEEWKKHIIKTTEEQLPKLKGRAKGIAIARLKKAKEDLRKILEVKEKHPYLKVLL